MIFRQLFDRETCTYTYLLADPQLKTAVIIDPVKELAERDIAFVEELGLQLEWILETHVHADHVTGAALLKARFPEARTAASKASGANVDRSLEDGDCVDFGRQTLEVRATPGHTSGCLTYVTHDRKRAFTGDTLMIRGCGRTDFQEGSAATLYRSVRDKVWSLPEDCTLYPGHDYKGRTATTVWEEKTFNPRLGGGRSEAEFVEIMAALALSPPARIDVAVPANLEGGRDGSSPVSVPQDAPWAPMTRSGTGAPELEGSWLEANAEGLRLVDVREENEFSGELGHIEGAELVPLATLEAVARAWPRTDRIVTICRSGGRSGQAALALERMGFRDVASLRGGMLAWEGPRA